MAREDQLRLSARDSVGSWRVTVIDHCGLPRTEAGVVASTSPLLALATAQCLGQGVDARVAHRAGQGHRTGWWDNSLSLGPTRMVGAQTFPDAELD